MSKETVITLPVQKSSDFSLPISVGLDLSLMRAQVEKIERKARQSFTQVANRKAATETLVKKIEVGCEQGRTEIEASKKNTVILLGELLNLGERLQKIFNSVVQFMQQVIAWTPYVALGLVGMAIYYVVLK